MEAGSKKFRPIIAHVTCYLDLNFSSSAGTPANRQFQPDLHQDTGRVRASAPSENVLPIGTGKGICPSSRASSPPVPHNQHYLPGLSAPSNDNIIIIIQHAPRRTIERNPSSSILNPDPTTKPNNHYNTNPFNPRRRASFQTIHRPNLQRAPNRDKIPPRDTAATRQPETTLHKRAPT